MNEAEDRNRDVAIQLIAEALECADCEEASLDRVSQALFWLYLKGGLDVRLNPKWSDLHPGTMETALEKLVGKMLWMLKMGRVEPLDAAMVGDPMELADRLERTGIRLRSEVRSWMREAEDLMKRAQSLGITRDSAVGPGRAVATVEEIRGGLLAIHQQVYQRMGEAARSASADGVPAAGNFDELASLGREVERMLSASTEIWKSFLSQASDPLRLDQYICFRRQ